MGIDAHRCYAALNPSNSVTRELKQPNNRRARRQASACFAGDYPAMLVSLASMIRSGSDPVSALCECRDLFRSDSEMYRQLDAFRDNLTNGAPESQAIAEFGSNLEFRETQLFRSILLLSRNEGSSLGQSLVRLAKVTRQRQSFERKVRSALAMQRLSTVGLVLCALFTLGFQVMTNTAAVTTALANTGGAMVMALGVVLMLVGVTWMMVISRGRVGVNK